ncbi:hypothetical protein K438DRAFT_1783880 [Mycena galopus ATCC 62051]|nr:hypothetical protein K438DRAFT_1783880 [Mycena galopus ATCC 62051]
MGWPSASTTQNATYGYVPARTGAFWSIKRDKDTRMKRKRAEAYGPRTWYLRIHPQRQITSQARKKGQWGRQKADVRMKSSQSRYCPARATRLLLVQASRNGSRVGGGREKLREALAGVSAGKAVSVGNNGNVGVDLERKDQDGGKREGKGKRKDEEKQTTKDAHTHRSRQPYLRHCGVEKLRRTGLERLLSVADKEYKEEVP